MPQTADVTMSGTAPNQKLFTELRVSGHLMTLESGLFCIVQAPGARKPDDGSGLPGVRISLPPGPAGRPQAVSISSFRPDGWLNGQTDAALVRVTEGPAQVLVTVYQAASGTDTAPRLQVLRLAEDSQARPMPMPMPMPAGRALAAGAAPLPLRSMPDVVAHVQIRGDVGAGLGEWVGDRGSKRWIEGFVISPQNGPIAPEDIEYQAVLGRGWLSPWVEGGQLCGSRGMALPILGLRVRLRGAAAEKLDCEYSATFTDGTAVGPVKAGEACEAESLAPIEAFQIVTRPRAASGAAGGSGAARGAVRGKAKPEARTEPEPAPAGGPKGKPGGRRTR